MRLSLTVALTAFAFPAFADFVAPEPGTKFLYGEYEGGETPFITNEVTVLASNATGYVAVDGDGMMIRNHYGLIETHCEVYPSFNPADLAKGYPLTAGSELADGFVFVIGKDQPFWLDGTSYDTWAVREWTEHGSTWVTRISKDIGAPLDGLVAIEKVDVPQFDAQAVKTCLED